MSSKFIPFLLFFLFFTRFFGLFWGDANFFHPDENNMALAVSQLGPQNYHPNFFAYGQFPLYLAYFSLNLFNLPNSFTNSVYALRFWSALFSVFSVFVFYYLSRHIFKNKTHSLLFALLLIFTPGLIQLAHFGTTESLLILIFALNMYLAQRLLNDPSKYYLYSLSALVTGVGLASKISALVFITPIILVFTVNILKTKHYLKHIFHALLLICLMFFSSALLSPYNIIDYQDFISSMNYETAVATGKIQVFYTNQFINTKPIIFQFTKIFPYTNGLPIILFSFVGFFLLIKKIFKNKSLILPWMLILLPSLVYLIYFSSLYVKWTRFSSPIFFIFPLITIYFITRLKNKFLTAGLIFISIIPGLLFMTIYFRPDIRQEASSWTLKNITPASTILSEAGNVVNLPLNGNFMITNFDFYNLDSSPSLQSNLPEIISRSNYILVPSRRIFKNQSNPNFPYSQKYYQALFSGDLGFVLIKEFKLNPSYPFNSENAEETWSVFDHPVIRLFQKSTTLTKDEIAKQINP